VCALDPSEMKKMWKTVLLCCLAFFCGNCDQKTNAK